MEPKMFARRFYKCRLRMLCGLCVGYDGWCEMDTWKTHGGGIHPHNEGPFFPLAAHGPFFAFLFAHFYNKKFNFCEKSLMVPMLNYSFHGLNIRNICLIICVKSGFLLAAASLLIKAGAEWRAQKKISESIARFWFKRLGLYSSNGLQSRSLASQSFALKTRVLFD